MTWRERLAVLLVTNDVTETLTLAAFLEARLAEDEAVAWFDPNGGSAPRWVRGDVIPGADQQVIVAVGARPSGREWRTSVAIASTDNVQRIIRHDPARVLADVAAKRKILAEHGPRVIRPVVDIYDDECETCHGSEPGEYPCITLKILASIYGEHPDFDPAWAT
jgi:hypothetical protein